MMKCTDCFHYEACRTVYEKGFKIELDEELLKDGAEKCPLFKEKTSVAEVVRCEHCESWNPKYQWCKAWDGARRKDYFCNFGIRRNGNGST